MYRLKFRKSGAGIAALIIGTVLLLAVPYIAATAGLNFDLPLTWIAGPQLVLPLLFALVHYRTVPFIQQVRAFLVTCSFLGFFGLLVNASPPLYSFGIIQSDWLLHFNAAALGTMNLAALIAAVNLMQAEQMSSFADTKVAEAQLERLKAVKVDPDTQAKWEKAAAYADRSADGRSLRSTMTNLKAISLTEPGQELKPTMRESAKDTTSGKEKPLQSTAMSGDDGSLANLLDRIDDMPLVSEGEDLSASQKKPALSGNSFINDVPETEPVDTGASFLDKILNDKLGEVDDLAVPSTASSDMGLPAEEAETIDVAALLDSFPDESPEAEVAAPEPEPEPLESDYKPEPLFAEEKFEAKPYSTQQVEKMDISDAVETARSSSFANASSSRNSMPALQAPLNEGASTEVTALSGDDTSNFPVPNATPQGLRPGAPATSPTNTNNKLAAMKRRNTSTFTKLNALSASGTGSLKPPQQESEEPDSLRSLLDRLDDDKSDVEPVKKVEETAKPIEPPVELTLDTVFKGDGTPESAPLPKQETAKAAPVEKAPATAEPEIAPAAVEAAPAAVEAASAAVEEPSAAVEEPSAAVEEPAVQEIEEMPAAKSLAVDEPAPSPFLSTVVPAESTLSPELTSGSDSLMSSELEMASDSFMSPPSSFMAGLDGESSPLASLLDRSLGEEADSLAFPEAAAADQAQAEVKENVFGQKVDSDIDDIFSELAPPDAQKEVAETKAAKKPEPVEEPAHEDMMPTFSASESLFGSNVDGDIDNIFSELAPEAAQDKLESAPATTHSAAATTEIAMPEAAPAAVPVAEEAEEEPAEPAGSLFDGGLEAEIDDIFSELAPPEAQKEVKDRSAAAAQAEPVKAEAKSEDFTPAAAAAEAKAQAEPEPEPEADAEAAEGGLFGDDLGQELDNIFSGLTESAQLEVTASTLAKVKSGEGVAEEPVAAQAQTVPPVVEKPAPVVEAPAAPAASAAAPAKPEAPKYKEVKEFGRLSAKPTTTAKFAGDTGGTMKTIGKLLLDVQAVENIIKSGETKKIGSGLSTAKIISAARGEGIKNILNAIDTYEGVAGSLIVGHDGLVIASTVGTGWDKDMLGALSTALLSTSNLATKKLEIGKLRQMVMLTGLSNGDGQQFKTTVLTDVDVGILAVFLEKTDLQKIDGLLETIQTTIHGG